MAFSSSLSFTEWVSRDVGKVDDFRRWVNEGEGASERRGTRGSLPPSRSLGPRDGGKVEGDVDGSVGVGSANRAGTPRTEETDPTFLSPSSSDRALYDRGCGRGRGYPILRQSDRSNDLTPPGRHRTSPQIVGGPL